MECTFPLTKFADEIYLEVVAEIVWRWAIETCRCWDKKD